MPTVVFVLSTRQPEAHRRHVDSPICLLKHHKRTLLPSSPGILTDSSALSPQRACHANGQGTMTRGMAQSQSAHLPQGAKPRLHLPAREPPRETFKDRHCMLNFSQVLCRLGNGISHAHLLVLDAPLLEEPLHRHANRRRGRRHSHPGGLEGRNLGRGGSLAT